MIQLYWKNCRADVVGAEHGITEQELANLQPKLLTAHAAVQTAVETGMLGNDKVGFGKLPTRTDYRQQVKALADKHRDKTDVVILGIGGSALGNIAVQSALNPLTYNLDAAARKNICAG